VSDVDRIRRGNPSPGHASRGGRSGRRSCVPGLTLMALLILSLGISASETDFDRRRANLVSELRSELAQLAPRLEQGRVNEAVLDAIGRVRRHEFVPEDQRRYAYDNRPLSIGYGQTISQPLIVALMTDLLQVESGFRVFELGTGSGYQAAVLAELGAQVYSMEIVEPLAEAARARLDRLGYSQVRVRGGDGYLGWPEQAPFDVIIVTAAGDHIPPPLIRQLRPGGRMILPVGGRYVTQQLVLVSKEPGGSIITREILPVRFVPITGAH